MQKKTQSHEDIQMLLNMWKEEFTDPHVYNGSLIISAFGEDFAVQQSQSAPCPGLSRYLHLPHENIALHTQLSLVFKLNISLTLKQTDYIECQK